MYKYDGLVIYENHDDEGVIEVVEQNRIRSLHFGSNSRQSSIALDDPETLQLPYARAMMSWLLFKDSIDNAMILGLGGGSLARYFLYHFPECRLKAVEYRQSVVKIARSHFGLPMTPHLKVVVADAGNYIRQQAQAPEEHYSLIMVDAFDVDGLAPSISTPTFFDACKSLLKPDGFLVINLWATESALFADCVSWLNQIFADKVLLLPVRSRGNTIALAFNGGNLRPEMKDLKQKATELEQKYQLDFSQFLKDFVRHNPYNLHTVITK